MTANFTQETFYETLRCHGIELSDKQKQQFDVYAKMLVEWNEKMNLQRLRKLMKFMKSIFLIPFYQALFLISAVLCVMLVREPVSHQFL